MANTRSAIKRIRRTKRESTVNRRNRARLRTQVKKLAEAIEGSDAEASQKALSPTVSAVDRAVQKGIIKKNKASRMKSRLSRSVNQLAAGSTPAS
jgi:small subunit ribosomal protein S20